MISRWIIVISAHCSVFMFGFILDASSNCAPGPPCQCYSCNCELVRQLATRFNLSGTRPHTHACPGICSLLFSSDMFSDQRSSDDDDPGSG